MKEPETQEEALYRVGLIWLGVAIVLIPIVNKFVIPWLESRPLGCIFWELCGAYCPGCGGTRAVKALFHGHILQALWYHPLVPYSVALYFVLMFSWTLARFHLFGVKRGLQFRAGYLYAMLVIIAGNFILKNVLKFCFGIVML